MSATFKIPNFAERNIKEITRFAGDFASGVTALTLANNNNIIANDYLVLGRRGGETTEIKLVASVASVNIATTSATGFAHNNFDEVTAVFGNKLRIYRAANATGLAPADGDFTLYATIDIDIDQVQTDYTDATGSSGYWYKVNYYNSTSLFETALADSKATRGAGYGNYVTVESVRNAAGFKNNTNITDFDIDEKRQAAQDYINSRLYGVYTLPFTAPVLALIENIARMIAVKYIYMDQYGAYDTTDKAITEKINMAEKQLTDLRSGQLVLLDANGSSIAIPDDPSGNGDRGFSGWPNASTAEQTPHTFGAGAPLFTITDITGYEGRQY